MDSLQRLKESSDKIISAAGALIDAYELSHSKSAKPPRHRHTGEQPPVTLESIEASLDEMTGEINAVLSPE